MTARPPSSGPIWAAGGRPRGRGAVAASRESQIRMFPFLRWTIPALCVCVRAACGASATSEKTRPGILEHVSCGCCRFLSILGSLQAPRGLCACRRRFFFLKKHAPGILEHAFCGFCRFLTMFVDFCRFQGPPSPLRLCRSCRRRFFSWKNTPLDVWSMYFVDVVDFSDFRVPWSFFQNMVPLLK